jgi:DNA-binding NtrC family response regulator
MRKRRAIIIEPDAILLRLFRELFLAKEYEVFASPGAVVCPIHAENDSGLPIARPCADVLITDYALPGMSGLDLLEAQSRHGCALTPKNKALIAGFVPHEMLTSTRAQDFSFFEKPIKFSRLEAWIGECEARMSLSQPLAMPRKEERHSYSKDVPCVVRIGDRILNVAAINSSRSGLCVRMPLPLLTDQMVRVQTEFSVVSPLAAVRWVTRLPDSTYLVGLNFC